MTPTNTSPQRPRRRFTRWVAIALAVMFMPIFVFGATVAATGTVTVRVHEHGPDGLHLWVPVPALLVDVAAVAVPMLAPSDVLAEARRELAPYRAGLEQMAAELENCPSGVLVEVHDGDEHVLVVKDGGTFRIRVESDDADVSVSLPARLLGRSLDIVG